MNLKIELNLTVQWVVLQFLLSFLSSVWCRRLGLEGQGKQNICVASWRPDFTDDVGWGDAEFGAWIFEGEAWVFMSVSPLFIIGSQRGRVIRHSKI